MTVRARLASPESQRINRKVSLRILPFLCALMFVSYLDRISLAYAGPNGLNADLGLSATAFGFAAGIFFVGYILFELPSNIALQRFGARTWLARIIITWGVVQTLTAFVPNATVLYGLRFLLGVAEAGLAPGVILYLTYWFSDEYRSRAVSRFLFSVMVAAVVGAPLSLLLVSTGDTWLPLGLVGWRFLLLATGAPAIVLGIAAYFYLDDGPEQARWLSRADKDDIAGRLASDQVRHGRTNHGVRQILRSRRVWTLGLCYFSFIYGAYALTFFLPAIVAGFQQQFGVSYTPLQLSLLVGVPFLCGGLAQLWFGRHADRHGRLGTHVAISALIGLIGGVAATFATEPIALIICICFMAVGITGGTPLILVLASRLYVGVSAAAAIALVNTIGISAGFFGPYVTGWLRDLTGQQNAGILLISALLIASGLAGLALDRHTSAVGDHPSKRPDPSDDEHAVAALPVAPAIELPGPGRR